MRYSLSKIIVTLGVLLYAAQFASAQFVQYGTRASWLSATNVTAADDYESYDFNASTTKFLQLDNPTTLNGITYSSVLPEIFGISPGLPGAASYLDTNTILFNAGASGETLTIDFNQMLTSFSVDFGQTLEDAGATSFTFAFDNGVVFDTSSRVNDFSFLGLTFSDPFKTVTISAGDLPVIDNLAAGVAITDPTPVPEPATYGLVGAATLLGYVILRRRVLQK